ncbi:MAG: phosphoenolpyruvate carboxykinase, partial [Steroidobacteraceae bacterium]
MTTNKNASAPLPTLSPAVAEWVASVAALTTSTQVVWCEGSDAEYRQLVAELERSGELQRLNA